MLRRQVAGTAAPAEGAAAGPAAGGTPLRWRLAGLTFAVVAFAVGAVTLLSYWTVSTGLTAAIDRELDRKAITLLGQARDARNLADLDSEIRNFSTYVPGTRVSLTLPGWTVTRGDPIPVGGEYRDVGDGFSTAAHTVGGERILTKTGSDGAMVVLARDMGDTHRQMAALGMELLGIAALGVLLAIAAGLVVATTGLRPLQRLQRAVEYVADTDDLRPIDVHGNDSLAQLTRSINAMLAALRESRTRQAELVADAGHELKTPLTSMRTNIELLMMLNRPGAADRISEQDRRDLERDVMAQMTEMSTLIGDLVDLAREDSADVGLETVELDGVVNSAVLRVRRRRADVAFQVSIIPWELVGEQLSLDRAVVNLLDNAAKWSPESGVVRVRLQALSDDRAELSVSDSGPGIRPENRERVFERFYRAPEARSEPGSGLGLAIVKQTVERHGGTVRVAESEDGGARVLVELPGRRPVGARAE
ncbi:HAMP domain-containing sensor histidine kinase [Corynebacterium marinum]|uniref:histidine kinase n=1 Tax=Corynebacterium marinum DSM 44953 TaxID=1224162 RepID=A0A0B6TEC8_9CORY|nr:HAMP domain-containing sensor histidine kinase [Corynebacterium marinum]AJK68307.1 signal transduction histidine-protein kinase/phosphatase MprB [Corynebacterium marinum DSM 44953]GGO15906.1 two-component sensor histidine kinase [Corynebacterium marinum]